MKFRIETQVTFDLVVLPKKLYVGTKKKKRLKLNLKITHHCKKKKKKTSLITILDRVVKSFRFT